jgi:hypothetical protein
MHWCQQALYQLGVTAPPTARDFLYRRHGITPDWYIPFLHRTRAHIATETQPILQLAPKPNENELKITQTRLKALQQLGYEGQLAI